MLNIEVDEFVGEFAKAVGEIRQDRVTSPVLFTGFEGQINNGSFFVAFESYCLAIYKKDLMSWL